MMKQGKFRIAAGCLIPMALAFGEGGKTIGLFSAFDIGRLESGYDLQSGTDLDGLVLNRTIVDVSLAQQLNEKFLMNVDVGGIFWKAYAPGGVEGPDEKVIKFGPGIYRANLRYAPRENLYLDFGYFPYKYNASAKNLGEYLFRTEAYPTIIYTGGWSWMNDVQYHTVGAKLTWITGEGSFRQDLGLFGEYFNSPIYDLTPAYIATWKPASWLTLGGACALHRFITPTRGTKKALTESWDYYKDFYFPAIKTQAQFHMGFDDLYATNFFTADYDYGGRASAADSAAARNQFWMVDSVELKSRGIADPSQIPIRDTVTRKGRNGKYESRLKSDIIQDMGAQGSDSAAYWGDPNNAGRGISYDAPQRTSFDLSCVKLLAFFSLDFNDLLGLDAATMGEFSVYGEVAQLGLKNYPIFYTSYAQRRPIMLGLSIPTHFLQHLSFEVEYLKNPTVESIRSTFDKLELIPDQDFRYQAMDRDDWKWSLHAALGLPHRLSLFLQVANDHLRLLDKYARPEFIPATSTPSDWYWLTRLQCAI